MMSHKRVFVFLFGWKYYTSLAGRTTTANDWKNKLQLSKGRFWILSVLGQLRVCGLPGGYLVKGGIPEEGLPKNNLFWGIPHKSLALHGSSFSSARRGQGLAPVGNVKLSLVLAVLTKEPAWIVSLRAWSQSNCDLDTDNRWILDRGTLTLKVRFSWPKFDFCFDFVQNFKSNSGAKRASHLK